MKWYQSPIPAVPAEPRVLTEQARGGFREAMLVQSMQHGTPMAVALALTTPSSARRCWQNTKPKPAARRKRFTLPMIVFILPCSSCVAGPAVVDVTGNDTIRPIRTHPKKVMHQ